MRIEFSKPIMDARQFAPASVKAQPELGLYNCHLRNNELPSQDVVTFSKARYALAAAALFLKQSVKKNIVLLPEYHCPALVEPFIFAGYEIRFYPQGLDLKSDLLKFEQCLTPEVSHVVVIRYFGFSQNVDQLIKQAALAGKRVIEDSAHSMSHFWLACSSRNNNISAAVSSLSKTLGTADGGVLYLPGYTEMRQQADILTELKSLITGARSASASKQVNSLRYFSDAMLDKDCLRVSRWLMLHSNYKLIGNKRLKNYRYLISKLQNSRAGCVLYPTTTDTDVPYVLPFILNDIKWFTRLREQQVQVLRWEELALPLSDQANELRHMLVQLPVHQALSTQQLDKIVKSLT